MSSLVICMRLHMGVKYYKNAALPNRTYRQMVAKTFIAGLHMSYTLTTHSFDNPWGRGLGICWLYPRLTAVWVWPTRYYRSLPSAAVTNHPPGRCLVNLRTSRQ